MSAKAQLHIQRTSLIRIYRRWLSPTETPGEVKHRDVERESRRDTRAAACSECAGSERSDSFTTALEPMLGT